MLYKHLRAFTILELLASTACLGLLSGALFVGLITLQRSFEACKKYADSQTQQMRLCDSLSLDLRRALSAKVGPGELELSLPDFFISDPETNERLVRMPTILKGEAVYGDPALGPKITYYQENGNLIRREVNRLGTIEVALCQGIKDFMIQYEDSLGQTISVTVNFQPQFQWSGNPNAQARQSTSFTTSTLLRNQRRIL